jgi:putative membrane protein
MTISKEDQERIASTIHSAEEKTSGEIVCVLARSSCHATALPLFIAAIVALALPWLLMELTALTVERILSLQIIVFLGLLTLLCMPRVQVALMPRKTRRAIAHRVAMEQFINRGIGHTKNHAGILIFASLAERYARIIVDDEVAARVPQSQWQAAVDGLITHTRDGRIGDGFVAAIGICGDELAKHFPRTGEGHKTLPDRVYLI